MRVPVTITLALCLLTVARGPILRAMQPLERSFPLGGTIFRSVKAHVFTNEDSSKISLFDVSDAEDIFKFEINSSADDHAERARSQLRQRGAIQHGAVLVLVTYGNADAVHFSPVPTHRQFMGDARLTRTDELDGRMPEKIASRRLAGIFRQDFDQRRFTCPDSLRHEQNYPDLSDINVSPDLSLTDPARFGDGSGVVAGLPSPGSTGFNPEADCRSSQHEGECSDPESEKGSWIFRRALPEGFAMFTIVVAGSCGGLIGLVLVGIVIWTDSRNRRPNRDPR